MTLTPDEVRRRSIVPPEPLEECGVCGDMIWKHVCLAAGAGGGLSIGSAVYHRCGCGVAEQPKAAAP